MNINDLIGLFREINLYKNKLLENKLTEEDIIDLSKKVKVCEYLGRVQHELSFELGRIIDYHQLLVKGTNLDKIREYMREDDEYLDKCKNKINEHMKLKEYMFGYPANMMEDSSFVKYLRYLESKMFLINNCGAINEHGNYKMDNKDIEKDIIDILIKNLQFDKEKYTGYITTGGTEGNLYGVLNGLKKYPNANLYYSNSTHYSINKINYSNKYVINTINDKINLCELILKILNNYEKDKKPIVLVLNDGTTCMGSIDEIRLIKSYLIKKDIPHYIHVDAALYGGIGANQKNSPYIDFSKLDIDSISISLHKYLGLHECKGIVLTKKYNYDNYIDYIGQNDTTLSGSRDFPPFSTYQRARECLERSNEKEYYENIKYFEGLLFEYKINYYKGHEDGNIFIIDKPSNEICEKYQLATFEKNGKEYAHIIIFPYHKKDIMNNLVMDIKNMRKDKQYGKM